MGLLSLRLLTLVEKRNMDFLVTRKWVLYIDADERNPALQEEIALLAINIVSILLCSSSERFRIWNHEWPHIGNMERLFKRASLKEWWRIT
jgi:hypothetical protein